MHSVGAVFSGFRLILPVPRLCCVISKHAAPAWRCLPASAPPAAIMSRHSTTVPSWMSWSGLVYYGETLGFVLAWVAGIVALSYTATPSPATPEVSQVASAGNAAVSVDRQ